MGKIHALSNLEFASSGNYTRWSVSCLPSFGLAPRLGVYLDPLSNKHIVVGRRARFSDDHLYMPSALTF